MLVPFDVLQFAFEELAAHFKAEGKVGVEIDKAAVAALPVYLATLMQGNGGTEH